MSWEAAQILFRHALAPERYPPQLCRWPLSFHGDLIPPPPLLSCSLDPLYGAEGQQYKMAPHKCGEN